MGDRIQIKARCRGCGKTSKLTQPAVGFDFFLYGLSGSDANGKSEVVVPCPRCGDHIRLGFARSWQVRAREVKANSYVTINRAHRVVSVDGDEATVSVRDPATGNQQHVIYPTSALKVCDGVMASGDAKRTRLAPNQPAPPSTEPRND